MKVSPHFALWELTKSSTAKRRGISNKPDARALDRLRLLCEAILEPVRELVGKPIRVNSGYRSPELNAAIGGSKSSQHMKGEAADVEVWGLSNLEFARLIRGSTLPFDQLILEHHEPEEGPNSGWVHVSTRPVDPRGQVLTAMRDPQGRTIYVPGLPGDSDD